MITEIRGDLHCHTNFSDGSLSIYEAAQLAEREGMQYLAITDHDTIDTFDEIDLIQPKLSVTLIKGVELSAYDYKRHRKVHILCYMPLLKKDIKNHCERLCKERKDHAIRMIDMVARKYSITYHDVFHYARHCPSIYKQHIMHALADRGYTNSIFGELYDKLFDPKTGSCYLSCPAPDVYDVLDMVKNSGGIAVFAHPAVYNSYDLVVELCEQGLIDGIEVAHTRNKPGDKLKLTKLANKYGLLKTGGSDFHGMYSSLPVVIGDCYAKTKAMEEFINKHAEIKDIFYS